MPLAGRYGDLVRAIVLAGHGRVRTRSHGTVAAVAHGYVLHAGFGQGAAGSPLDDLAVDHDAARDLDVDLLPDGSLGPLEFDLCDQVRLALGRERLHAIIPGGLHGGAEAALIVGSMHRASASAASPSPTSTSAWGMGWPVSAARTRPSTIIAGRRASRDGFRAIAVVGADLKPSAGESSVSDVEADGHIAADAGERRIGPGRRSRRASARRGVPPAAEDCPCSRRRILPWLGHVGPAHAPNLELDSSGRLTVHIE